MSSNPITSRGPWLTRLARKLIVDARQDDGRHHHTPEALLALATHAPELAVELLLEVARHVDDEVVARIVTADDRPEDTVLDLIAREAHRLRDRGDRSWWVLWGETTYQRLKSRRRRQSA